MENFLVRVVLHSKTDLSYQAYSDLHIAMERAGFSRRILSTTNIWYQLPPAEYMMTSAHYTLQQLYDVVFNIVVKIDPDYGILVSALKTYTWGGLKTS